MNIPCVNGLGMTGEAKGQKTFILGLGAQKTGTSWLYNYLASSGTVATHVIKEYHVWDALCIPGLGGLVVKEEDSETNFESRIRFFLQQSPENYFSYFAYMMHQQGKLATCDITPLYSGLDRKVLTLIREGFAQRGIATKAVFLMRDPVERCWSSARMDSRNKAGHTAVNDDEVLEHAMSRLSGLRTRYDTTVTETEAALAPSQVHFGIYEEMFEPANIAKLSVFCRVSTRQGYSTRKSNVSEVTTPISEFVYRRIAAHYREVYDFAARRFPQTTELWPGFRYL